MKKIENILESFPGHPSQYNSKILGLEFNDKYLVAQTLKNQQVTRICTYYKKNRNFMVLFTRNKTLNVIQASVNSDNTVLIFVTKDKQNSRYYESEKNTLQAPHMTHVYNVMAINLRDNTLISDVSDSCETQIMVQFLYRKKPANTERFLIFTHLKTISLYEFCLNQPQGTVQLLEIITNSFSWAQWDAYHQCLFYIHFKRQSQREDDTNVDTCNTPTLSAFQFHDDMPHETVLNVPLNLPQANTTGTGAPQAQTNVYNDVPIPLRIHDCSLNILVLMQSSGIVYICHHYFYKPAAEAQDLKQVLHKSSQSVHFAYTVTMLHHGSSIHCSVPGIKWNTALDLKPVFCMYNDQHLIAYISNLFTHVLDLGIAHEPCCHFVLPVPPMKNISSNLVPLPGLTSEMLDLSNFDILKVCITEDLLFQSYFNDETSLQNKLSILHYILTHLNDMEMINKIVLTFSNSIRDINNVKLFKEILVGGCYAAVNRHASSDSTDLLRLLPLTTSHTGSINDQKVNEYTLTVEQEMLCNPSVMLLTPRQRLIPFRSDIWTRLWNHLPSHILVNSQTSRFKNSHVVDKLAISLSCYQPEALSRCCTPLSPGIPHMASTGMLAEVSNVSRASKSGVDPLPFNEVEASAASKQEHVISINLREISLHLVKLGKSPIQIHAVAMRYASSQLEISRGLCSFLTQGAGIDTKQMERGFGLIDRLSRQQRHLLFALLERYYLALDTLAFPVPQGFTSFFAYLGYRVLSISKFMDYVRAHVLQVNIDVMKAIMSDLSDKDEGLIHKLNLLMQLPRSRVKRILNQWTHPISLMIRAREHSLNILSGISGIHSRTSILPKGIRHGAGLTAFPSSERLSPLDTFLDLLTAKASLAEIDFSLLIEATVTSTEDFLYK